MLWTTEPEVVFKDGETLIPRIVLDEKLNNRLNASKREVIEPRSPDEELVVQLKQDENRWILVDFNPVPGEPDEVVVDVQYSMLLQPVTSTANMLVLGTGRASGRQVLARSSSYCSRLHIAPRDVFYIPAASERLDHGTLREIANHVIASVFVLASKNANMVLFYDADQWLMDALRKQCQSSGFSVVFATSQPGCTGKDCIFIHPQASKREMGHLLSRNISDFVSLSKSDISRIQSCLPSGCRVHDFPSLFGSVTGWDEILKRAYSQVGGAIALDDKIVPLSHLVGSQVDSTTYSMVIDWTHDKTLPVRVPPLDAEGALAPNRTYWMVGLTGALGRSICQWMVRHGARYIALSSRDANINPQLLAEMERLGACVRVYKMDVTNRASVQAVHAQISREMPPIDGVCNGAMVLLDKMFLDMNVDTLNETLRPKVNGTIYLDELFRETPLRFFILFSSLASVVGNAGQSNYHAANLFMEALAEQRRQRGQTACVISIGLVVDVGYVQRAGRKIEDHLRKLLYQPLSESDVHQLFAEALVASSSPTATNSAIHLGLQPFIDSPTASARPPWYSNPRFSHLIIDEDEGAVYESVSPAAKGNVQNLQEQLASANSEESVSAVIEQAFAARLESTMQLNPGSANVNVPLLDLGIDSLLALELRTWFLKELQVAIPVLRLLSGDSAKELCREAAQKYLAARSEPVAQESQPETLSPKQSVVEPKQDQVEAEDSDDTSSNGQRAETPRESDSSETSDDETPVDIEKITKQGPLSYAQSRLWFLQTLIADPCYFNIAVEYEIVGPLDVPQLWRAIEKVIDNHASMRTAFFSDPHTGEPVQGVLPSASRALSLTYTDKHADEETVDQAFHDMKQHLWRLDRGEVFGATLLARGSEKYTIIFGYHHMAIDGISLRIFLRDLDRAYRMQPLAPASMEYLEYAFTQQRMVDQGGLNEHLAYWQETLSSLPEPLPVPEIARVKTRSASENHRSHSVTREVDAGTMAKVKDASRALRVTPSHFFLAVLQILCARLTGADDFCIGLADANRLDEAVQEAVGFFLNILPIRTRIQSQDRIADVVRRAAQQTLAALEHSVVPLDLILECLDVPRSSAHTPLFQVAFNYRMGQGDMLEIPLGSSQMRFARVDDAGNNHDLAVHVAQSSVGTCLLEITARDSLYIASATDTIIDAYLHLLHTLAIDPECVVRDAPLFPPNAGEMSLRTGVGVGPARDFQLSTTGLVGRLDELCQQDGAHRAVWDESSTLSRAQLNARSSAISSALHAHHIPRGAFIASLFEPCTDMICSLVAIRQYGAVYVPLDVNLPEERHALIVQDCRPAAILCTDFTLPAARKLAVGPDAPIIINVQDLSGAQEQLFDEVAPAGDADAPAFLFYTSGSTGTPKGTVLNEKGFLNFIAAKADQLGLGPEVVLLQSSAGFNMSLSQILNALLNGGTVVIAPQSSRGDPVAICRLIQERQITLTIATPSECMLWLRYGSEFLVSSSWSHCCLGGETVTEKVKAAFRGLGLPSLTLTNWYGPTEVSAATSFSKISLEELDADEAHSHSCVGKPLPNTAVLIVDETGHPLPQGYPGEICIEGIGVAHGYLNAPELTQAKFRPGLADPSARMYKTGDRGRLTEDGSLIFLGRKDDDTLVKLRGLRINLDEIATSLVQQANGDLIEAVVSVRGDPQVLVAHVVFAPERRTLDPLELRGLSCKLPFPSYMCPEIIVPLETLPLNPNGKVDRRAIQGLEIPAAPSSSTASQPLLTVPQAELMMIWQLILPLKDSAELMPDSDFFMVGGNSMLLARLQGAIKEHIGVSLRLFDLYHNSTLTAMTDLIASCSEAQLSRTTIDWTQETALPVSVTEEIATSSSSPRPAAAAHSSSGREIILTGALSFLGSTILRHLLRDKRIKTVHCICVPDESRQDLEQLGNTVKVYTGSLLHPQLGLTPATYAYLQSNTHSIIHAGAQGHCLNSYHSLRVPNVASTRFLSQLAIRHRIPIHYISSSRVVLLSGQVEHSPQSVASYPPATDGSEGFTASKWASEVFLENLFGIVPNSDLPVYVHRPCAVLGSEAPREDALNALIRFSLLMRKAPRLDETFQGYLDMLPVEDVARGIIQKVFVEEQKSLAEVKYRHYSSQVKVPVGRIGERLEQLYGVPFEDLDLQEWVEQARGHGLDEVIASYVLSVVEKGGPYMFPYLGS